MIVMDMKLPKSCAECDSMMYSGFWCKYSNPDDASYSYSRHEGCPIVAVIPNKHIDVGQSTGEYADKVESEE